MNNSRQVKCNTFREKKGYQYEYSIVHVLLNVYFLIYNNKFWERLLLVRYLRNYS